MTYTEKLKSLISSFTSQFNYRLSKFNDWSEVKYGINYKEEDNTLFINFIRNNEVETLRIPLPFEEKGVVFVHVNGVKRSVGKYFHRKTDQIFDYLDIIREILIGNPRLVLPIEIHSTDTNTLQSIRHAYKYDNLANTVYLIQKKINYVVNKFPVHETYMNSWAMNHRLTIIDPDFDEISDPKKRHEYQINKNKEYFSRGWTSMGLSDGSLSDYNYILTTDLRKLTPFGLKLHNPQRNLYSTLGMKGDEKPLIISKSMKELENKGLFRTGWNLFTVFVDIPDVWEDQIMVDESMEDKFVTYDKTYTCYGNLCVEDGDYLKPGDPIAVNKEGKFEYFDIPCDLGEVVDITDFIDVVGGESIPAKRITIKYTRYIKEGAKITNLSANKGIIRFAKLGYAIDPRTGEKRKIDVIVSAKAVLKRKNYAQVIEALINNLNGERRIVVEDDAFTTVDILKPQLLATGFKEDGTWECYTYKGKFNCVAGTVFWGLTHDAEDTIWDKKNLNKVNGRNLREAGLKFSTIEFRALRTRFGNDSPIENEIISWAEGVDDLKEQIKILKSKIGKLNLDQEFSWKHFKPLRLRSGILFDKSDTAGTIIDNRINKGFMLSLPVIYKIVTDNQDSIIYEGPDTDISTITDGDKIKDTFTIDKIYVPHYNLRKPWKHSVNKYGLNDLGNILNNIITISHQIEFTEDDQRKSTLTRLLYRNIYNYFKKVENKLGTKRGEISVYGMSVRYPHSTKAVATLSNDIPKDHIQIHKDTAETIGINDGDIVLVERFPCLGFLSIRPQKVLITDDYRCKYTIRVSGNSLGSTTLDFDGDVIYTAAFKTKEANELLHKEWSNPNPYCKKLIEMYNAKMGQPRFKEMALDDYNIHIFDPLTNDEHASIVSKAVGVKSYTGPVVALAYNLLRILENSNIEKNIKTNADIEVFMDKVTNSVFKQKHGVKSLHHIVIDAVCTADVDTLIKEGFDPTIANSLCSIIIEKAAKLGIRNLKDYHKTILEKGGSSIINRIVRSENQLYFLSRANLDAGRFLACMETYKVIDTPSSIFTKIMSSNTKNIKPVSGKIIK